MSSIIRCPSCDRPLRVPDAMIGKQVRCPTCQTIFRTAADADGGPGPSGGLMRASTPPPPAEEKDPYAREEEELSTDREPEDEASDDLEEEPRPGRRRGRRARVKAMVAGPAIALMIVSSIGFVLGTLNVFIRLTNRQADAAAAERMANPAQAAGYKVGLIFGTIVAFLWGPLVFAGAWQMKSLGSYGGAMAASIMAMLPCNVCCLLGLPFGIWGLVVLNNPDVRDAFG